MTRSEARALVTPSLLSSIDVVRIDMRDVRHELNRVAEYGSDYALAERLAKIEDAIDALFNFISSLKEGE